jgi:alpha-N-arabinofuranosidase
VKFADLAVDPAFTVAPLDRRIFGSFVEHLGRSVYTGIFEPEHPAADESGFRADVPDLVRVVRISTVRYPGGNFVSGYRWEDGVGPVQNRPSRLDIAWHSAEPNTFGVDEFETWAARAGVEPMLTTAPVHETAKYGDVPVVDAVATHDPDSGALTVVAVNRGLTEPIAIGIDTRSFGSLRLAGAMHVIRFEADTTGALGE